MAEFKDVPVDSLLRRFEESKKYRKKYEGTWDENRQFYDGDQWGGVEKLAWFQSEPVYNKIYEFVELHRAYLSDSKWGVDVAPASVPKSLADKLQDDTEQLAPTQDVLGVEDPRAEFFDMVDKCNKLLDFLWMENRMKSKLSEVILFSFLYGTGFIKSVFDPNNIGDSGIGQIESKVVSPWYIFPDPNATSVHDASFIFEHHPVTYRWILERYPEKAAEVRKAGIGSNTEYFEQQGDTQRGPVDQTEAKRVDILECWYIDSSIIEDDEGEGAVKLQYPNGRMTLMTTTGVVLEDKPNPYSMFPYVRFVEVPRPGEFFGDCTVNRCVPIQKIINSILRTIIDNGIWLVHGIWVTDTNSGVDPKSLAGYAPRDVLVKNPGTELRRDEGQPLPPHLFEMLRAAEAAHDRVAGVPDVLRGIVPSRQPVGTVEMQKDAGEVRTRERQRRVEEALEDLGSLWLDIVSEHWNDKRIIRNKMSLGGFEMFEMSKKDFAEWKFDVHVVPGSTAPRDVNGEMEKLFSLIERGGVPVPPMFLVETAQVPGLYAAMSEEMASQAEQAAPGGEQPMDVPEPQLEEMAAPMEPPIDGLPIPEVPMPTDGTLPPEELLAQQGLV